MNEKMRMITEKQYDFYKKMISALQDFYKWSKENRDEPREYVEQAFGDISNETLEAVEYAFEEGLVE